MADQPMNPDRGLAAALQAASLKFEWAEGVEGLARMGVQFPHRPSLDIGLEFRPPILRMTAYNVLPPEFDVQRIADRAVWNEVWGLGRVYYHPVGQRWDASLGIFLPDGLSPEAVKTWLAHLADAVSMIQANVTPRLVIEPPVRPPEAIPRIMELLKAEGADFDTRENGALIVLSVQPPGASAAEVHVYVHDSLLVARASRSPRQELPPTVETYLAINQLNAMLSFGAACYWHEYRLPYLLAALPWRWTVLDRNKLMWLIGYVGSVAGELPR